MLMISAQFDGKKLEKAKMHYERFNQYIKFQTKEGNIKDTTKEAIELFEHKLYKKALIWFQQHKAKFNDLMILKSMFLARYSPWGGGEEISCNHGTICPLILKRQTLTNK